MTSSPSPQQPAGQADRGSASVSIAIIFPAIALLFLALAQAVIIAAAHDVAVASAEEGLRAARANDHTLVQGQDAAIAFARHEPVLGDPRVAASGTTTITVTVRGTVPSLLPGLHLSTSGAAAGARERFTTETRGFAISEGSPGANPRVVASDG